jgi:cell division protein ZapA (FtsZ GTPase activity inhibitor)
METEKVKLIVLNRTIQISVPKGKEQVVKHIALSIDEKVKELQKTFPKKDVIDLLLIMLLDSHLEKETCKEEQITSKEEIIRRLHIMHQRLEKSYLFLKKEL